MKCTSSHFYSELMLICLGYFCITLEQTYIRDLEIAHFSTSDFQQIIEDILTNFQYFQKTEILKAS